MLERIKTPQGAFYRLNWWYQPRTMVVWKWLALAACMWLAMYALAITDLPL